MRKRSIACRNVEHSTRITYPCLPAHGNASQHNREFGERAKWIGSHVVEPPAAKASGHHGVLQCTVGMGAQSAVGVCTRRRSFEGWHEVKFVVLGAAFPASPSAAVFPHVSRCVD
eukprot:gene10607-biopygen21329